MQLRKHPHTVSVLISNKEFLNDPEGETILNDLILKENYTDFLSVRSAKSLTLVVMAENDYDAIDKVKKMCDDLRIYNPVVSKCDVFIKVK